MKNKIFLIKNKNKYRILKLAKGLNLDTCSTSYRFGRYGISTEKYKNVWFETKKGKAIFKSYDSYYLHSIFKNRIINEMLCSIIGKQIGVSVATYEPATIKGQTGLVSYDVTKEDEQLLEFYRVLPDIKQYDMILPYVVFKLKSIKNYNYDIEELNFQLYKMLVFDALTFQEDRHGGNVFFILDKRNFLHLSPLIDNEMSFGANVFGFRALGNFTKQKFLKKHAQEMNFLASGEVLMEKPENRYSANIKCLVDNTLFDRYKKDFLINALKNIDVVSAFLELENMGYKVDKDYQDYVYDLVEIAKNEFKTALKKVKENNIKILGVKINVK